ncbi:hypothetical protein QWY97_12755 [Vibrio cortegadensis]|uniref:hypothetical protein n=1 Tax=Vibrio cortegadensis TaxID=1328770 RepID=UPI0021C32BDA|nr:hypothetical protein [Vibrio cortegadensis]MDN3698206.1 hypothetical protein [Vibrio cortegadensis]
MKRFIIGMLLASSSTISLASDTQCLTGKYDAYIDASLTWYQDLVDLTSAQYPDLNEVGEWFLEGRKHHFELNRAAVHYYLKNDSSKVATEQPIEAWLQLEQKDIKELASNDNALGKIATSTFNDRQSTPHDKNYELRSAFADLLSHPKNIDSALNKYNQAIKTVENTVCK